MTPSSAAVEESLSLWERVRVRVYLRKEAPKIYLDKPCLRPSPQPSPKGRGVFQQSVSAVSFCVRLFHAHSLLSARLDQLSTAGSCFALSVRSFPHDAFQIQIGSPAAA